MARRAVQLILALLTSLLLAGCMDSARTANLYTQDELDARAVDVALAAQAVVDITPAPTKLVTPFVPTPSPTLSPTPSPTPSPSSSAPPTPAFTVEGIDDKRAYLNAGSANLRTGPGTDYDIIRELSGNAKLTVTGSSGEWLRVEAGDDEGFVLAEFVEYGAPPTAKPTTKPTATPKPSASASPSGTATASPAPTESAGSNDYFTDANGFTADELLLIAQVVHQEAKGTSLEGQAAVANVILNRINSSRFPNTVEGVIFQKSQFTVASDEAKLRAVKPGSTAIEAVKQIFVEGDTFLPADVMYFRASHLGTSWSSSYKYYATYGGNCFFIYIG